MIDVRYGLHRSYSFGFSNENFTLGLIRLSKAHLKNAISFPAVSKTNEWDEAAKKS